MATMHIDQQGIYTLQLGKLPANRTFIMEELFNGRTMSLKLTSLH
jgi:hypothetical protein